MTTTRSKIEVWVSHETLKHMLENQSVYPEHNMRLNARFADMKRALAEARWYTNHGYVVEVRDGYSISTYRAA